MNIHPEVKQACQEVIHRCYYVGRFTQREYGWLDQVIQWFDHPQVEVQYSFSISVGTEAELVLYCIEFNGRSLLVDAVQTSYNSKADSNPYNSYSFSQSAETICEDGLLCSWRSNVLDALRFISEKGIKVEISIDVQND